MTPPADSKPRDASEPRADRRTADFGVVCSHRAELRGMLRNIDRVRKYSDEGCTFLGGFLRETNRVAMVEAGNGFASHRKATEILIREHQPAWIFSVGFCSALAPQIRPGDLVLANHLMDTHGHSVEVACRIPESKRIHVGKVIIPDAHPVTPDSKQRLAETEGVVAADTVSLAVAQVSNDRKVKFMSIRGVVDGFDEVIPERAAELVFAPTSRAWGGALGGVVRNLRNAGELNEWRKRTRAASDHLGQFVCGVMLRIAEKFDR